MGQILVGGATAKFDLKSAFFVGDVLYANTFPYIYQYDWLIVSLAQSEIAKPYRVWRRTLISSTCTERQKRSVSPFYCIKITGRMANRKLPVGAVSYYEIPSRAKNPTFLDEHIGDTVPAGRGMKNVQLLVVNREDAKKICEIGETGEIYVVCLSTRCDTMSLITLTTNYVY